jgi:hypothetical protein
LKELAGGKRSSLFCSGVSGDEDNRFEILKPGVNVTKLFTDVS